MKIPRFDEAARGATRPQSRTLPLIASVTVALAMAMALNASWATAQEAAPTSAAKARPQSSADSYTRYELLEPITASFRIVYDVSATSAGATRYYNPIRPGSEPTVHSVTDRFTGKPLAWRLVDGKAAAQFLEGADPNGQYIEVTLARPVPEGGEARLRIDKTYADKESYSVRGTGPTAGLVFERSMGIPKNSVILPPGYELTACSMPVQVAREASGRIRVSFINRSPGPALLRIEARPLAGAAATGSNTQADPKSNTKTATKATNSVAQPPPGAIEVRPTEKVDQPTSARLRASFDERAFQDREIVYYLQEPETHAFRLYHDYTESRPGVDRYLNIVRPGSRASDPSATVLDTGESLKVETLRGSRISEREIEIGEAVTADTELVVIWFDAVVAGQSKRLRIWETYTDPGRYGLDPAVPDGSELVWDRSFGRASNAVVLPAGWWLVESSIPARIDLDEEGRVRLLFENDRPDAIDVLLRARRR